ncbi:endosialidase-like protein [Alteromonadaceae bacterium 2753L.S.0a.02]|nr:endosialidase-like protein [Alteromonadaceae bacterium 2753L.S.0a.02]
MALPLTITDAGRAALVNATNNGTLPIVLQFVKFGSGQYTPNPLYTALLAEFKLLSTISGDVVAPDQIHVTVRDESTDQYTLNEIGLYTDDNVLFALYSSPTETILEKAEQGIVLLSLDIAITSEDAANIAFGDTSFLLPGATELTAGVIAKATTAEATARSSNTKVLTPKTGGEMLATHENAGTAHSWAQISGKPTQATRWPLWTEVTNKPTVYPAASHLHSFTELINLPVYTTRWPAWSEVTSKPATYAPSAHGHPWSDLSGVPSSFTPSAHGHAWSDLSSVPTQATRWPAWSEVTSKPATYAPSAHGHPWSDLSGVPSSFTPSAHGHAWSDLSSVPTQATRWPAWSEVTSKPSTFTPSAHGHSTSDITGLDAALAGKLSSSGKAADSNLFDGLDSSVFVRSFVIEDGDGTEVSITHAKEIKFVEGGGIDINWTDTSTGSDADPFDLTFTVVSAPKLSTARTISLGNQLSGSANFDGSGNITINATVAANSHGHTISNVDGLELALSGKLSTLGVANDSNAVNGLRTQFGGANYNVIPRTDSSGYTYVGRYLRFYGTTSKTDVDWQIGYSTTGDNGSFYFYNDGGLVRYEFTDGGEFRADGDVVAGYSDERLKNIIGPITNAIESIKQWRAIQYTATQELCELTEGAFSPNVLELGITAQSVEQPNPELIRPAPFDLNNKGESISGEHYITLRYERTTAVITAALQELISLVEAQGEQIKALESVAIKNLSQKKVTRAKR